MFTGLVEEQGRVIGLDQDGSNLNLKIQAHKILEDIKLGDSIAIDGVCQTVVQYDATSFMVTAIAETLRLTNFGDYKLGSQVNLERCLRLQDRIGGHLVQGHVDAVGELQKIDDCDGSYELKISIPENLLKYIIYKGSITLNGISLTVAERGISYVKVCIIPKTWEITNLSKLVIGSKINIEVDLVAKYLENLGTLAGINSRDIQTQAQ